MQQTYDGNVNRWSVIMVCGVALVALLGSESSQAQGTFTKTEQLNFSRSVALPGGVVLPAGSYAFELSTEGRNVVRVRSRNRSGVTFTAFANPVERPASVPRARSVTIGEVPAGSIPPIMVWYPQGSRAGYEFVYP